MVSDPPAAVDLVEIAGRTWTIEHVALGEDLYFCCGVLPARANRADLIRDIALSQGPEWRVNRMSDQSQPAQRARIPTQDDPFLRRHAGRMFELLCGVDHHPSGYAINEPLRLAIQTLFEDARDDGIDTIGVAECGLQARTE